MDPKCRALLWEELRVGGAIASVCTAAGVLLLAVTPLVRGISYKWVSERYPIAALVLGIPLLVSFLLILRVGNSGHLTTGFSPRILLLPVETSTMVCIAVLSRFLLVLFATLAMAAPYHVLYHKELAMELVLVPALFYLCLQTLDWLSSPMPLVAAPGAFVATGLTGYIFFVTHGIAWRPGLSDAAKLSALAGFLSLSWVTGFAVSLWAVELSRGGHRMGSITLAVPRSVRLTRRSGRQRFYSAFSALVWYEFRSLAVFLPALTAVLWAVIGLALLGAWLFTRGNQHMYDIGFSNIYFYISNIWYKIAYNISASWNLLRPSFMALLVASACCGIARSTAGWRKKDRRPSVRWLYPVTSAELAAARLAGTALVLVPLVFALTILSNAFLFLPNAGGAIHFFYSAVQTGEASCRELLAFFLGVPILYGFVAWVLLSADCLFLAFWIPFVVAVDLLASVLGEIAGHSAQPEIDWFFAGLPIVFAGGMLLRALRRGVLSYRHVLMCLVAWAAVAAFFYPYRTLGASEVSLPALYLCVSAGALVVLSYPAAALRLQRIRHGENVAANAAEHGRRPRGTRPLSRRALAVLAGLGCAGFLVWLRWPAEPAYKAALRAQGYPATASELVAWRESVPDDENLALRCLEVARFAAKKEPVWIQNLQQVVSLAAAAGHPSSISKSWPFAAIDEVKSGTGIPSDVWQYRLDWYATVGRDVELRAQALPKSGLTKSRYPGEMQGMTSWTERIGELRPLFSALTELALAAAIHERPDDVGGDLLARVCLANSLDADPLIDTQEFRIKTLVESVLTFEAALNVVELSGECLAQLQEAFGTALPRWEERRVFDRAFVGERALILDELSAKGRLSKMFVDDLSAGDWFERLVVVHASSQCISSSGGEGDPDHFGIAMMVHVSGYFGAGAFALRGSARAGEMWGHAYLAMAEAACAVERYRAVKGRLPDTLGELVPEFIEEAPGDPWNDWKPLSYRVGSEGEYVIRALNRVRPEGGIFSLLPEPWEKGDWTFTVVPPDRRNPPPVIPEAPPQEGRRRGAVQ